MEDQKEEITIIIDKNLATMLKGATGGSQSSLSTLIQNVLYRFPMNKDFNLLGRIVNVTNTKIPILEEYYEQSRNAIEFWRVVLPIKSKAEVLQDQEGHYFAKFPRYDDCIPLPETGHLLKDIEEGTKNIERVIKVIPKEQSSKRYRESFLNKLKELNV